jgi:hypothetical protein
LLLLTEIVDVEGNAKSAEEEKSSLSVPQMDDKRVTQLEVSWPCDYVKSE